jgi:hypothetical protein
MRSLLSRLATIYLGKLNLRPKSTIFHHYAINLIKLPEEHVQLISLLIIHLILMAINFIEETLKREQIIIQSLY